MSQSLSEKLGGYVFADPHLLTEALTHASARGEGAAAIDFERLEFLGDRVLGLVVAELIMAQFPAAAEGELARRFNRLVRKDTCAAVAREIGLGPHLILGAGEAEAGGRNKDTILADACEAVLGAVFLDGGFEPARALIRRLWTPYMEMIEEVPLDPKTALQEWAQGRGLALPRYQVRRSGGPDHAPQFAARVVVEGFAPAAGEGTSKAEAQREAAHAFLRREGVWKAEES